MADLSQRTYTFEISFCGEPKRQYKHSNPTKRKRKERKAVTLKHWRTLR